MLGFKMNLHYHLEVDAATPYPQGHEEAPLSLRKKE